MPAREGILLIGGTGFLGSALAKVLANEGHDVHVLARHAEPGKRDDITFHRGGQDDPAVVPQLLKMCATVVHLASTTTPGSSARHPTVDTQENLMPAARLVELMARQPPRRLLFVSSGGSIYGNPVRVPVDETAQPRPLSYHAAGKLALESLFDVFAHASRLPLAILRPSNLYGPAQPLLQGFGFVRTLLDRALHGDPVETWGNSGTVRDYLFIEDAVDGCLRLLQKPAVKGIFNLGSGVGTSLAEMVALVEQVTGCRLRVNERPARGTDVRAVVLDSTRLTGETGWTPRVALTQGLEKTWEWVQKTQR